MKDFWRYVGIGLFAGAGLFGLFGAVMVAVLLSPFV